ncbi:MAG: MgtC/SapB family protein [[Clostridium] fimetarium]|nr:MgtC/SapB family protein [Alistipes timonensis]MCM1405994.1 MgtC/SapB family protein [[Clostridium] fimetarium]
MFENFWEILTSTEINMVNAAARLLLSMALGAVVGAERKRKGQIAGVRTFALISMGACLAMLLSIYVPQEYLGLKNGDPGRIAAQVVTGVGFLGGGAMIHMKGSVKGLTTAAGIWITATIGMAVGVGMYFSSMAATALTLLVLAGFEFYEHRAGMGQESRAIKLTVDGILTDTAPYSAALKNAGVHLSTFYLRYDYDELTTDLTLIVLAPSHSDYLPLFDTLAKLGATRSLTLSSQG